MGDNVSKDVRSKTMRAIRSRDTKLERSVARSLHNRGIRFRKNTVSLPGKPDISIKKYKVVIFVDSCFWHGCPRHCRLPKTNIDYWEQKIERNKERDGEVNRYYAINEWLIIRIWEHQLKDAYDETINTIVCLINNAKQNNIVSCKRSIDAVATKQKED